MKIKKTVLQKIGLTVLMIVISGLVFASLAEDIIDRETLSTLDPVFGSWLIARTSLTGDYVFSMITFLGNALVISAGTAALGFLFARKKYWGKLVFLFSEVGGGALLNLILKNIFQRSRPVLPRAFMTESGYSFPSGHAMISLVFYGALAYLALQALKTPRQKFLASAALLVITASIGFSRLYLGVHYLTDVMAGWAAGGFWLGMFILGDSLIRLKGRAALGEMKHSSS